MAACCRPLIIVLLFSGLLQASESRRGRGASKQQQWALDVPRVTQLDLEQNATLRSGHVAFILTGLDTPWAATESWADLKHIQSLIPEDYAKAPPFHSIDGTWVNLGLESWKTLRQELPPKLPIW